PRKSPRRPARGIPDFHFPAAPPSPKDETDSHIVASPVEEGTSSRSPAAEPVDLPVRSKVPPVPTINEQHSTTENRPLISNRILAPASQGTGTPRSSGEFYSMSNNSSETLASEYPTQPAIRPGARPAHLRLHSMSSLKPPKSES